MNNNSQPNNDFQDGFLIKDKSGKFTKISSNKVVGNESIKQDTNNQLQSSQISSIQNKAVQQPIKTNFQTEQNPPKIKQKDDFVVELDDEEEIKKHQEELNKILSETPQNTSAVGNNSTIIIDDLTDKFKLNLDLEIYKKRFAKIVESRIKEIRSSIETIEVLHRPKKIGGLEIDREVAKDIVREIGKMVKTPTPVKEIPQEKDSYINSNETRDESVIASAPPAFIPMPSAMAKSEPKVAEEKMVADQSKIDQIKQPSETKPIEITKSKLVEKPEKEFEKIKDSVEQKELVNNLYSKTPTEAMAKISKQRQAISNRAQVIDIRQPANIIGPVEEIGEVDLKEFRRMGQNPSDAANKVLEKIYLLEEDSWSDRMKGLHAWQQSPLYKLYIDIGRKSIDNNQSVVQIISRGDKQNLHMEEFLAINSLNNQLGV